MNAQSAETRLSSDLPLQVIEPPKGWFSIDWRELWRYRELFGFLVWRDIKVKYKQTLLGVAWAILVPLMQMLIFSVIGSIAGVSSNGIPRPVFYFSGMIIWTYFATSFAMSSNSLIGSANLLRKIYFPRIITPCSPCLAGLLDLAIAFPLLLGMMVLFGIIPPLTALLLPIFVFLAFGTALGCGLIFSALNVKYRDIRYIVPPLVQMWMFCSTFLSFNEIRERLGERLGNWVYLYGLNPMGVAVEGFRWCMLHQQMFIREISEKAIPGRVIPEKLKEGQEVIVRTLDGGSTEVILREITRMPVQPPWDLLALAIPAMLVILALGLFYFRRMESQFADIV